MATTPPPDGTTFLGGEPDENGNVLDSDGQAFCDGCGRRGQCEDWCPHADGGDADVAAALISKGALRELLLEPDFLESMLAALLETPTGAGLLERSLNVKHNVNGNGKAEEDVKAAPTSNSPKGSMDTCDGTPTDSGFPPDFPIHADVLEELLAGGISPSRVRFIVRLSGCVTALNNNKGNVVKAFNTMFRPPSVLVNGKPGKILPRYKTWLGDKPEVPGRVVNPKDADESGVDPEFA